jgi:hypothetical protein
MYDGYRATGVSSFFYFISLIVCGQFIIMNIFLVRTAIEQRKARLDQWDI